MKVKQKVQQIQQVAHAGVAQRQVEQLLEEQPLQPPPPATGAELPLELLVKAANVEIARCAPFLHVGQGASSLALLIGRSSSNLSPHLGQQYS